MIVVSDTSPLHYLILINEDRLLPTLFERVIAPPAVIKEMDHPRAPVAVRAWVAHLPDWLEIRTPQTLPTSTRLGGGETEAIALAHELHADVVLIDERDGAKFAREQGLFVTGVLGVLQSAAKRNLVSLSVSLQALGKTSFRHTPEQFEQLLKEFAEDDTD